MKEIHEIDTLYRLVKRKHDLQDCVIQGMDLSETEISWEKVKLDGAIFLGCSFPSLMIKEKIREGGALLFPKLPRLPYQPYRPELYRREELAEGWTADEDKSVDKRIYDHFESHGRHHCHILEALSQRLHDHAIDDALQDLLSGKTDGGSAKRVVAVMGGHSTSRADPYFEKVVLITRELTRAGYFVASGGGPGIMEAANLGAWIANADDDFLETALRILRKAPKYTHCDYVPAAQAVLDLHPDGGASVAIPTWFYGHEPSNLFSTWIAKYFSNSLREDGLLAIAKYGVIYAPGSAGTTQEIFMDAAQNHYGSFEFVSPMVFLGTDRYQKQSGLFPTIQRLAEGKQYEEMLALFDEPEEVVRFIQQCPPKKYQGG